MFTKEQFTATAQATHVTLSISAEEGQRVMLVASESDVSADVTLTLECKALGILLPDSGALEKVLQGCEGRMELWQQYVDRILSLIRLEYCEQGGVMLCIVGCFSEPVYTSLPWPEHMIDADAGSDDVW
jgi:hypothetical protein